MSSRGLPESRHLPHADAEQRASPRGDREAGPRGPIERLGGAGTPNLVQMGGTDGGDEVGVAVPV